MVFDLSQVTGIGAYEAKTESLSGDESSAHTRTLFLKHNPESPTPSTDDSEFVDTLDSPKSSASSGHLPVFLVDNTNTIELRCDSKLSSLLQAKYESVMKSRYFGSGGIEIVLAGHQLTDAELDDLIRLSYNLTK